MLSSTVVENTTFVLILSSRYVSGGFSLVDCIPCLLMCRCPTVVFLDFSRCLLISFSVRLCHIFRKSCFVALRRLAVVGMKSDACSYYDSSGLDVWAISFFFAASDFCVSRFNYHIPVFLFLMPLFIFCPLLWTDIYWLSSVMVHP